MFMRVEAHIHAKEPILLSQSAFQPFGDVGCFAWNLPALVGIERSKVNANRRMHSAKYHNNVGRRPGSQRSNCLTGDCAAAHPPGMRDDCAPEPISACGQLSRVTHKAVGLPPALLGIGRVKQTGNRRRPDGLLLWPSH
jgi:hypothetical protein